MSCSVEKNISRDRSSDRPVHHRWTLFVVGDRGDQGRDRAGQIRPQIAVAEFTAALAQDRRCLGLDRDAAIGRDPSQHLVECFVLDRGDEDLRTDATVERLVGQLRGVEVGGEDDLGQERHFELRPVLEAQEVDVAVEGYDPAVQQLLGGERLAAEVVDRQHPVVRDHLQRGQVHPGFGLVVQLELVGLELTARDHTRPRTAHPAPVEPLGLGVDGHVHHRVVHGDDLAVDLDRVGHEHGVVLGVDHPLGDRGLAGARGAVQEDRPRRVNRRSELGEQVLGDHQILEAASDVLPGVRGALVLLFDHRGVFGEAHRHCAGVLGRLHALRRERPTLLGKLEQVAAPLGTLDLDHPVVAQLLDHLIGEHRRHVEPLGQTHRGGLAFAQDAPHRDVEHEARRNVEVLDSKWLRGICDDHWSLSADPAEFPVPGMAFLVQPV